MKQLLLRPLDAANVLAIGQTKLLELLATGAVESVGIARQKAYRMGVAG